MALPLETAGGMLEVFDAQGAWKRSVKAALKQAFIELDTRSWEPSLYKGRFTLVNGGVAEVKFSIVR